MQISPARYQNFTGLKFNKKETKEPETSKREETAYKVIDGIYNFLQKDFLQTKVPDCIEFKKAETIQEAKRFARKNLGIASYKINDLNCANYVNEALSEFYNNSSNKNALIDRVRVGKSAFASINAFHSTLEADEEKMRNVDNEINRFFKTEEKRRDFFTQGEKFNNLYELTERQKNQLKRYGENPNSMELKEKMGVLSTVENLVCLQIPSGLYYRALKDENVRQFIKEASFPDNLKEFKKLDIKEQTDIVQVLLLYTDFKITTPDSGDFQVINHELGHKLHAQKAGFMAYDKMASAKVQEDENENKINMANSMHKFATEEPDWDAALSVSKYAGVSPAEFVAETYAALLNGVKFDDTVMKMYEKYKGPAV